MNLTSAKVIEIRSQSELGVTAWIACPPSSVPKAGRYLHAWARHDLNNPLGTSLFLAEIADNGFLAAPPIPNTWRPGTQLVLQGPLGQGFKLPSKYRRLALATVDQNVYRLLPLAHQGLEQGASIAIFTDFHLPELPVQLEVNPLETLPEALAWGDFLALDVPIDRLDTLSRILGINSGMPNLTCPTQVLLSTSMPCAGIGACGACAIHTRRGWKLACKDGPVFDLQKILQLA